LHTYLPSRLLGSDAVVAGFSTRRGGDDLAALAADAGFDLDRLYMLTQVHGARVVEVAGDEGVARVRAVEADALVTAARGVAVAVRTADCVPVLLADDRGHVVAAAHAGWRGLVAGVIGRAVEVLCRRAGAEPAGLVAAVGPAIDACCFEVGDEVARQIARAVGNESATAAGPRGRPHVDLRRAAALSLAAAGVAPSRIELVGPCTRCAASHFHSYRRAGAGQGRQVSFVALRGAPD
jgi:hypothetical protein